MTKAISRKLNKWKVRETIRKQLVPEDMLEEEIVPDLISYCLRRLNTCSAGTALYILDCLWPDDFGLLLDLIRLDLSCPHQHKWLAEKDIRLQSDSYEDLLAQLRVCTSTVPLKEYPHFWLELTKSWLLTCPVDPDYYLDGEAGSDIFRQKLRGELVERLLRID